MLKRFLLASVCASTFIPGAVYAQDETRAAAPESDDIIVTATLRNENLQQVPIAITAFDAKSLDRSGVVDVRGLGNVAASINFGTATTETSSTTIRIRGVGTMGNNTGLESSVGIFLDGVYLSRPGVALADLLDVEQIELLRGPQGTLFGRNTTSGAVQIRTKKPNLREAEGFANITYGNYDLKNVQAGVSIPIKQDELGLRVSGAWRDRDGWLRNTSGGESNNRNRFLVRGQLYWEPTSDISVRLIGDYSYLNEKCCDAVIIRESSYVAAGLYAAAGLPANGGAAVTGPDAVHRRISSNDREYRDKLNQWGTSMQIDWDTGIGKLTSITGYRHWLDKNATEPDFVSVNVFSTSTGTSSSAPGADERFIRINTFTQELRLAGSALDDRFDFLVGGFYADEQIRELQSYSFGPDHQAYVSVPLLSLGIPGPNPARDIFAGGVSSAGSFANNLFTQSSRNWSIFTNNTFHITDAIGFNFGLRYSNDRKRGSFEQLSASSPACDAVNARAGLLPAGLRAVVPVARSLTCFPFITKVDSYAGAPTEFNRVFKDSALVYTGKLTAELTDDVNSYLSYSRGYKSGGFNLDPTAAIGGVSPSFNSEKVDAYEIGIKTRLLDRRLTANLALFHQDFTDFQLLEFTGVQFLTYNVPKTKSSGAELELTARPSDSLTVNTAVTYTDARFPKGCGGATPAPAVALLCGQTLAGSPKWVVISGFDYDRDIGSSLNVGFSASMRMESDRRTQTQALVRVAPGTGTEGATLNLIRMPNDIQDANVKVNLRAGIGSQSGSWRVELWGNNIFNVQTVNTTPNTPLRGAAALPGAFNAGGISLSRLAYLDEPRTYGVTLRTRF